MDKVNIVNIDKVDFKEFLINNVVNYENTDMGLLYTFKFNDLEFDIEVILTSYDILYYWQHSKEYNWAVRDYSEDELNLFEDELLELHNDIIYNSQNYTNLSEISKELNNKLLDFYEFNDEEIDLDISYEQIEDIESQINDKIEEYNKKNKQI